MQTTGDHGSLPATQAITTRILVQKFLCHQFHLATAGNHLSNTCFPYCLEVARGLSTGLCVTDALALYTVWLFLISFSVSFRPEDCQLSFLPAKKSNRSLFVQRWGTYTHTYTHKHTVCDFGWCSLMYLQTTIKKPKCIQLQKNQTDLKNHNGLQLRVWKPDFKLPNFILLLYLIRRQEKA